MPKGCPESTRHRSGPSEDRDPVTLEGGPDGWAETIDLTEVHGAAESILQQKARLLHADQGEGVAILDLYGEVYVAVRLVLAAGDGPEHREMANAAAPKLRFLRREL